MDTKPYFIRLQDAQKAQDEGYLPQGTVAFVGPHWVLVTFTEAQRAAYPYAIEDFTGQQNVVFHGRVQV